MSSRVSSKPTDVTQDERPSQAVVSAVADAEGIDPVDLDEPLYVAVDPDGLDALFREVSGGRVQFTYYGYEVTVYDDGRVHLEQQ